jgi:tetratricopeptide (TPR) repeat protein
MRRNFFFSLTGFFLLCSFLAGCTFSLRKEIVYLHPSDECPEWTPVQLEENLQRFNDATDTFVLECALEVLRNTKSAPIHQTAAGAQLCFLLADRTETDQIRRERFASEGVRWAERALKESAQDRGDVYYYLAVNLGIAVKEHTAVALRNLDRLVSSLEKALELSPDVNYGGPYRVLGMLYLMAPPWPQGIGDGDRALELLQEAVRRHPEYPKNHVFYAQALWEIEGEPEKEAITGHLHECLVLMNQEQWQSVKDRWIDDVNYVAQEAHIELSGTEQRED